MGRTGHGAWNITDCDFFAQGFLKNLTIAMTQKHSRLNTNGVISYSRVFLCHRYRQVLQKTLCKKSQSVIFHTPWPVRPTCYCELAERRLSSRKRESSCLLCFQKSISRKLWILDIWCIEQKVFVFTHKLRSHHEPTRPGPTRPRRSLNAYISLNINPIKKIYQT